MIPSRELESPSREFGALPEIPTRRDFVGRARLAGAALAGGHGCIAASVHSAFDDVRLASQFESPPSTQSPSSTQAGRMAGVRRHKWPDPAVRIGTFPRRVVTARLSVADRVLDQFSADGAEENYLYCKQAPRGFVKRVDIRGLAWADNKSNEFKKMPHAHDGAGVESARSFLHYGPKQS